MQLRKCRYCGAALDPEEHCECEDEKVRKRVLLEQYIKNNMQVREDGQMQFKVG